jgi:hypothetical protein
MSFRLRLSFMIVMTTALLFGFMHLINVSSTVYDFERLHIFLFNLCCGATILIYHTEQQKSLSFKGLCFFVLSMAFGVMAFLKFYIPAIAIAFLLFIVVESVRWKHFSIFPVQFFSTKFSISEKFHHAALLCLSIGLLFSIAAIINEEFYTFLNLKMVKLNTFFLGFSFPISLITMSIMFSFMQQRKTDKPSLAGQYSFWAINMGVIIFFIFILFDLALPQVLISSALFFSVILIFFLFYKQALKIQQKSFLNSGMFFLMITAISGVFYIYYKYYLDYNYEVGRIIIRTHAFTALYGWNLSGLAIICRYFDFPIRLHSRRVIVLHWVTVLILAPIGYYFLPIALLAIIIYAFILYYILLSDGEESSALA